MLYELLSNLIGSILLYYDFIFVQVTHIAWIYLLWWIRLIRQQFVVNCSSSGRCSSAHFISSDVAYDGFIKLQFEKFAQTGRNSAEVSTAVLLDRAHLFASSSFIDFHRTSKKCISWRMLTKFQ